MNKIKKFLVETQQIIIKNKNIIIKSNKYTCLLKNILQKNVIDVLTTNESKT